jgi:hypothetical protein
MEFVEFCVKALDNGGMIKIEMKGFETIYFLQICDWYLESFVESFVWHMNPKFNLWLPIIVSVIY